MDRLFANGTVNAAQSGEGPPLFLFHSLLSDRASFDAIVPELSKSFRVIVPELPGFGRSHAVTGGLADVADRMAEAVRDAAGGTNAIVLGNGYGGFVALQMAIRHPNIASQLVLADCGAAFTEPGREAFLRTDAEVFRAACEALASLDLRPELQKVKIPVLVLVGEHDEATPPPMSHELAAGLPQAHLEIIPGCAHVPQLQSPAVFLDVVGDFLPATNSAPA